MRSLLGWRKTIMLLVISLMMTGILCSSSLDSTKLDEESDSFSYEELKQDDFWADFYISGEDELLFENGTYYMDLYLNGEKRANITIEIIEQRPYLYRAELTNILSENLTEEAFGRVFREQSDLYSLEYLEAVNVQTEFDSDNYAIYLDFKTEDMPLMVISITSPYRSNAIRPISGAITVEPAVFTWKASHSFNLGWNVVSWYDWDLSTSLYSSSTLSLFDTYLDFAFNLSYDNNLHFDFGSWVLYHDFPDKNIRLSVGNISSGLLAPNGTPFGFRIAKSTAYGENIVKKSPYSASFTLDKESLVEVINEGRVIYSKTLLPGNYKLEDFVLYTGANRVLLRISPTDGTPVIEEVYEFSYYSSLLYPGEFYYTVSLTAGEERLSSSDFARVGSSGFSLGKYYYQYDPRNLALSFDFSYGITHSLMLRSGLSIANNPNEKNSFNPSGKLNIELTQASVIGTTRYNLNLTEKRISSGSYSYPQIYARIGHQVSTGIKELSSFNINATLNTPSDYEKSNNYLLSLGFGLSGRLGFLGYSLGGTFSFRTEHFKESPYSLYSSISFSPFSRVSISASMNIGGSYSGALDITGSIYASLSFNGGSSYASSSGYSTRVGASVSFDSHYLSASLNMPGLSYLDEYKELDNYNFSASYSTSGKYFNIGFGISSPLDFQSIRGNVSLSTRTIFSDGYFALSSSLPSSALLVRQKGILKGNDIYFGYGGSSSFMESPKFFGTTLYGSINTRRDTNLVLYSEAKDSLSTPVSFALNLPKGNGRSYVYTLESEPLFSITGIAEYEDSTWINGSSPLYRVEVINNSLSLSVDESAYVFTDETGRFVISDLKQGMYAFDMPTKDGWTLVAFRIDESAEYGKMNLYKVIEIPISFDIPDTYSDISIYECVASLSSEEFWDFLYPMEEL